MTGKNAQEPTADLLGIVRNVEQRELPQVSLMPMLATKAYIADQYTGAVGVLAITARKRIDAAVKEGYLVEIDPSSSFAITLPGTETNFHIPSLYIDDPGRTKHGTFQNSYTVTTEPNDRGFCLGTTTFIATPGHVKALTDHFTNIGRNAELEELNQIAAERAAKEREAAERDPGLAEMVDRLRSLSFEISFQPTRKDDGGVRFSLHAASDQTGLLKDLLRHGLKTAETVVSGPETREILSKIAASMPQAEETGEPVEIPDPGAPDFTAPGPLVDEVLETLNEAHADSMPTTYEGHNPQADRWIQAGQLAELRRITSLLQALTTTTTTGEPR